MVENYPTPKDRKQMAFCELILEYPKIGFAYRGIIHNKESAGLEVRVTKGSAQYSIPTATMNADIAIQEALFTLTNIVVVQGNSVWLEQFKTAREHPPEISAEHSLLLATHLWVFSFADYIRRIFS